MSGLTSRPAFTRATVQIAGSASRITASHFRRAVRRSNPVRDLVVNYQEALLAQVEQTAACNALHAVQFRLGRWLLQSRDSTESNTIPLTQAGLSQMLGVRRSAVNSAARVLQGGDLIRYSRGQIEILDRRGLEKATCKCYDVIRGQVH
ncbi:MAG: Crp/Fnr family transcriptional regulator [Steroidobacteraceae bacterium]